MKLEVLMPRLLGQTLSKPLSGYFEASLRRLRAWSCAALGCSDDCFSDGGVHVLPRPEPRYENDPFGGNAFRMLSFGNGTVMSVAPKLLDACRAFTSERADTLFEGEAVQRISALCREAGERLEISNVHFLFREGAPCPRCPESFEYLVWERDELERLYALCPRESFHNAFAYSREKDVLAVTASKDGRIVAAAGCDDRIRGLWQVGVDTLPDFRGQGLSAWLTRRMAEECATRGETIFYSTWPANLASYRTAIRAGFLPVNFELGSTKA